MTDGYRPGQWVTDRANGLPAGPMGVGRADGLPAGPMGAGRANGLPAGPVGTGRASFVVIPVTVKALWPIVSLLAMQVASLVVVRIASRDDRAGNREALPERPDFMCHRCRDFPHHRE
jgi:hypothetical protein